MAVSKRRKKGSNENTKKKIIPVTNKLSQVILEFVKPLSERKKEMKATKTIIEFGILVWNIALLPIEDRDEQKSSVHKSLNANDVQIEDDFNTIFDYLINRKDIYFKDDKRFIVNYEINGIEGELQLTVESTKI